MGDHQRFVETFVLRQHHGMIAMPPGGLGQAALDEAAPDFVELLADTALYSRKGAPGARAGAQRAIDRIAPKLPVKRDPLKSLIAARLPDAIFSVFAIDEAYGQGGVVAQDLLDGDRAILVMDNVLAMQVAEQGEMLLAGRFLDLGPWHVGFGVVLPLRKSEALAISLALSHEGELEARRGDLHELLYPAHIHDDDLVMTALEPLIAALALAIDMDMIDIDDLVAPLGSLLPGKPASKRKRRAASL